MCGAIFRCTRDQEIRKRFGRDEFNEEDPFEDLEDEEEEEEEEPPRLELPRLEPPPTFAHIFRETRTEVSVVRVLELSRLSNDPFYELVQPSAAGRWWMMRYTPWLPQVAHMLNGSTILRYFESMGREGALRYFRMRRAPQEIIRAWEAAYPAPAVADASVAANIPIGGYDDDDDAPEDAADNSGEAAGDAAGEAAEDAKDAADVAGGADASPPQSSAGDSAAAE